MENNLPEDSIQKLFYNWFVEMQRTFDEKKDSVNILSLIEKFPEVETNSEYKWKLSDGTEI